MFTRIIFIAALIAAPGIALAVSASFKATVVPPGSNPIACDYGVPYTGSIPAPAQAAGFTHCVANFDFAQTQQFTDNFGTHQWSDIQSWLTSGNGSTCVIESGKTPLFYIQDYGANPYAPCSDFTTVNDTANGGAAQVLRMGYIVGDVHAATNIVTTSNFGLPSPPGIHLYDGFYSEQVMRLDASYAANTSCPPGGTQACLYFDYWSIPFNCGSACQDTTMEFDFIEAYAQQGPPNNSSPSAGGGSNGGDSYTWMSGCYVGSGCPMTASQLTNGYNTIGERATVLSSGSPNWGVCWYLSGSAVNCGTRGITQADISNAEFSIIETTGPQYQPNGGYPACLSNGGCTTVQQNMYAYIERLTVWACSNYASGPCYSSSLDP
jgi:hypothetical protein